MGNMDHGPESGNDSLHNDNPDWDVQGWYVMQTALDEGRDPKEAWLAELLARRAHAPQQRDERVGEGEGGTAAGTPAVPEAKGGDEQWPPGRAGAIAWYIFANSYSPVREVAIAATLGLLAGVCGRAYRTYTGKDLALYLILVAKSGIGKDSTHEGIPATLKLAAMPMAERFVRAQDFVSGEALHKELLREPGFLALQGEFGRKLKRMSNPLDTPMQNLRTVMTNAFGKAFLEGKSYSNADNSLDGVDWPALSFLGETTPGTFLECLTADMMGDGFMSRFLCINYEGDRPPPNRVRQAKLGDYDHGVWTNLVSAATRFQFPINTPLPCIVPPDADARKEIEAFEMECIAELNKTSDESERQVWSRAHLKALKVASLLAVVDEPFNPVVRITHVAWSLNLVRKDIAMFQTRKRSGDIGIDDNARERKLVSFLRKFLVEQPPASYKVPDSMWKEGIVPRAYLQMRCSTLPAFCNHKLGANRALYDTISEMQANGYLSEQDKLRMVERHSFHGKAYRILKLPDWIE